MNFSNIMRTIVLKLPKALRSPLIRRMIRFPTKADNTLRFKIAETKEELEQAFALLHDAYVKEKLMTPHPSGLRVTKYHALPSTTTLIALEGDVVVGTVSLIRRGPFGVPLEAIFNLDELPQGSRIAEVSSLAIKNGMQQQRGRILFPMLKFMYHYSREYFGVTHYVIAVNPKWYDFYESVLLFKPLAKKIVDSYEFVNGAPAVGGILDIKNAPTAYSICYGEKSEDRNLLKFFDNLEYSTMEYPLRKKSSISDPVLSPELMKYFFCERTKTFELLNDYEKVHLRELYHTQSYLDVIPKPVVVPLKTRGNKRYETHLQGRIRLPSGLSTRIDIQNVGVQGLGGLLQSQIPEGEYMIQINLENHEPCTLKGRVAWQSPKGHFGIQIIESSAAWQEYIQSLDERLVLDKGPAATFLRKVNGSEF